MDPVTSLNEKSCPESRKWMISEGSPNDHRSTQQKAWRFRKVLPGSSHIKSGHEELFCDSAQVLGDGSRIQKVDSLSRSLISAQDKSDNAKRERLESC